MDKGSPPTPIINIPLCWRRLFISQAVKDIDNIIDDLKYNNDKQRCPECESQWIEHDFKRDETVCRGCGLVLSGPPGYIGGRIKIQYPVQYNFFAELLLRDKKTPNGYIKAYYYFKEYTDNLYPSYHKN